MYETPVYITCSLYITSTVCTSPLLDPSTLFFTRGLQFFIRRCRNTPRGWRKLRRSRLPTPLLFYFNVAYIDESKEPRYFLK
jgi:hypothetical protein